MFNFIETIEQRIFHTMTKASRVKLPWKNNSHETAVTRYFLNFSPNVSFPSRSLYEWKLQRFNNKDPRQCIKWCIHKCWSSVQVRGKCLVVYLCPPIPSDIKFVFLRWFHGPSRYVMRKKIVRAINDPSLPREKPAHLFFERKRVEAASREKKIHRNLNHRVQLIPHLFSTALTLISDILFSIYQYGGMLDDRANNALENLPIFLSH